MQNIVLYPKTNKPESQNFLDPGNQVIIIELRRFSTQNEIYFLQRES